MPHDLPLLRIGGGGDASISLCLDGEEIAVAAAEAHKLVMRADLNNSAIVDNDDFCGINRTGELVRDEYGNLVF